MSTTTSASATSPANPFDPPSTDKPPAMDNIYGAGLIGTGLGLILYGLLLYQVYRYFRLYPIDRWYIKIYVVFLLQVLVETFHIILSWHSCYNYLVTHYLNPPDFFTQSEWSVNTVPVVTGVVAALAQCFFAHRVYFIGPYYRWIVYVSAFFIIAELGLSAGATAQTYLHPTEAGYANVVRIFSTSFGVAVIVDIILTTTLIYVLRKNRTGIHRTDSMIDVLIIYAINTGLLTGIFNLLTLIVALAWPATLIYSPFAIVTSKLYSNSVVAALNSRKSLLQGSMTVEMDTFGVSFATPPGMSTGMGTGTTTTGYVSDTPRDGKTQAPTVISIKPGASDLDLNRAGSVMEKSADAGDVDDRSSRKHVALDVV